MSEERALTNPSTGLISNLDDAMRVGKVFAMSGYFKDTRDASQAVVKIIQGHELGIPPMAAMRGIHIVEGKPELSAGLMAGLLQNAGYAWQFAQLDADGCSLDFYHGSKLLGRVSFGKEDAAAAGLANKQNYKAYGEDMFFARCISRCARRYAPAVLMGNVYVEGEITGSLPAAPEAMADVIESTATEVAPATPTVPAETTAITPWSPADFNRFWAESLNPDGMGLSRAEVGKLLGIKANKELPGLGTVDEVLGELEAARERAIEAEAQADAEVHGVTEEDLQQGALV